MLVKFVKTLLLDGFDINQFSQMFDAFFPFYQKEIECYNEIVIKVNFI